MEALPPGPGSIKERFMNKEFTMRLTEGIWNNLYSDQVIETTYMKTGKGPTGLKGNTLDPEIVKRWSLSLHLCAALDRRVTDYLNNTKAPHLHHKEEMPHRIELDRRDLGGLRSTLEGIIHPLDKSQISQHRELVNIFTGEYSEEGCDLHESINIGTIQYQEFEAALPDGFYDVIPRKVKPFKATRRNAQAPATETVNCDSIYSRTLGILNSGRDDVKIEDLLQYELSPVPLALFDKTTKSRSTDKSKLKSKLMIADTSRQKCDIAIIDATAVLRNLHWPGKGGLVSDFINTCREYVRKQLDEYKEVYFIFDRYYDHSIKGEERLSRAKGLTRTFVLQPGAVMPAQKTMMAVIKNKVQLIDLIVNSLKEKPILSKSLLMLTGSEKTPYKIQDGLVSLFPSLNTTHEEAFSGIVA